MLATPNPQHNLWSLSGEPSTDEVHDLGFGVPQATHEGKCLGCQVDTRLEKVKSPHFGGIYVFRIWGVAGLGMKELDSPKRT